ncbi:MAG: hypothetical protein J7501_12285 [Bdellovibrio sp.]|nr:hypothetical protein [Bdellovibrio sp.]
MKSVFKVLFAVMALSSTSWAGSVTQSLHGEAWTTAKKLVNGSVCFYHGLVQELPLSSGATLTRIDGEKVLFIIDVPRSDRKVSFKIQLSADGSRVEYYKKDAYVRQYVGPIENPQVVFVHSDSESNQCLGDENTDFGNYVGFQVL